MADNTPTTSGDVIATDDLTTLNGGGVSGVKAQRVKVGFGSDGSFRDVDLSNGLPIVGVQDARTTGTITSAASVVGPVAISNRNVVTIDISGTYAGVTFVAEASPDGGTTYYPVQGVNNGTGQAGSTWTPGTNASATFDFAVGGFTQFRVRATAWTSGTTNVGISMQTFAYDPAIATIAQGAAAAGAAAVGNPVLVGGSDGTNARSMSTDTTGRPNVNLATVGGGTMGATFSPASDGTAAQSSMSVVPFPLLYNGSTWDRQRGTLNTTTTDAGTKTASFTGATQTNFNHRGAWVYILCGTVSGTSPTLVAQPQWSPDGGTTWVNFGPANTALTATGNSALFLIGPNNHTVAGATPAALTTGATQTVVINVPLPRTWRLNYTIGGTTPSFAITNVFVNYTL